MGDSKAVIGGSRRRLTRSRNELTRSKNGLSCSENRLSCSGVDLLTADGADFSDTGAWKFPVREIRVIRG
jgi:hypothetical protein